MLNKKKYNEHINYLIYIILLILLILLASFRPIGFDADSEGYCRIMDNIIYGNDFLIEPMFQLIVKYSYSLLGVELYQRTVFVIFAFLHLIIVGISLKKLSTYPLLSLIIYILLFYTILAMTQIRFAIAASIFLLSIENIVNREFRKFLFKISIAFLFHYSAIIFLFFYFFKPNNINILKQHIILGISLILPLVYNIFLNFIFYVYNMKILPDYVSAKIYSNFITHGDNLSFTVYNIFIVFIIFTYIVILNEIKKNKLNIILLKTVGMGILLYMFFSFSPVISFRILNSILLVIIILFVNSLVMFKQKSLAFLLLVLISLLLFINTNIRNELLNWGVLFGT